MVSRKTKKTTSRAIDGENRGRLTDIPHEIGTRLQNEME